MKINIAWFRRDLRLDDNTALNQALTSGLPVLPVFIFDTNISEELTPDDPRISFIYETLFSINNVLKKSGSSIYILKGEPERIWKELLVSFDINSVFINKDYEPYAIQRDKAIESILNNNQIRLLRFKDQVIFEEKEIIKSDNQPYKIFTPYRNRWLKNFEYHFPEKPALNPKGKQNYYECNFEFPSLEKLGFKKSTSRVKPYDLSVIRTYDKYRDFPAADKSSYLGPHLRFGTVSIRKIVQVALTENAVFLNELIWREFFMQILFSFPHVVTGNFRTKYDNIQWRNDEKEFERWCNGQTGFPLVDAGIRQLNKTGYIHNRVRMIAAGFLCKHLLIDWRWGEAWFAAKLLDYELSSNNGNWQWAAGTGCDAAPYFRIFNPDTQLQKFDRNKEYVRKWIEEIDNPGYPKPMVDHDFARKRAIEVYKSGLRS
jgi:deoxyribodipyrimidine photo-lyase